MYVYLEKRDAEKNQYRFYALTVTKTLFSEWAVIREWGRIGGRGTRRSDWFDTEKEAVKALEVMKDKKKGRGYK